MTGHQVVVFVGGIALGFALTQVAIALFLGKGGADVRAKVLARIRNRRQAKRMRMRVEACEHPGCGKELRPHEVYELRSTPEDDGELGITGGGTWMSAVFCRKHYPGPLLAVGSGPVSRADVIREAFIRYPRAS